MTVIVYKDGVMASDSLIIRDRLVSGTARKITKSKRGILAGGAGHLHAVEEFLQLIDENKPFNKIDFTELCKPNDVNGIIVDVDGTIYCFDGGFGAWKIDAPFLVEGSGSEIATGALAMGASAIEAVEVAIEYNSGCGGKIQTVML